MAEHTHVCRDQDNWPHKEGFGCSCTCGAVHHVLGWQNIRTLAAPSTEEPEFSKEFPVVDLPEGVSISTEYRVMVGGGRGGREDGIVYQGTDKERAELWLHTSLDSLKDAWLESRTLTAWKKVEQ